MFFLFTMVSVTGYIPWYTMTCEWQTFLFPVASVTSDILWFTWSPMINNISRDHCVHVPSQLEATLHCNVASHWLACIHKMISASILSCCVHWPWSIPDDCCWHERLSFVWCMYSIYQYDITINNVYRKISYIRSTKFQNLNVSRLGLQLSLRNILKPRVKWKMKM